QGFESADSVGREIDKRLVVKLELGGSQSLAEIELETATRLHVRIHFRLEKMIVSPTVTFGAIQSHVGVSQELIWIVAIRWSDGDSDAGADHHLMPQNVEGIGDRVDDAARKLRCIGGACTDLD